MPEQLGSYNDVVAGSACKLLVLLSFWVAFIVLDEVDNGGAPVGVESQNLLPGPSRALWEVPLQS